MRAALRDLSGQSAIALLVLNAVVAVWYRLRRERTLGGDHLLLARYPAVVFVLAGPRVAAAPVTLFIAMAAVYLGACLYEAWHDRTSPLSQRRGLLGLEAVLLFLALAVLILAHLPGGPH